MFPQEIFEDFLSGQEISNSNMDEENEESLSVTESLALIRKRLNKLESDNLKMKSLEKVKMESLENALTLSSADMFNYSDFKDKVDTDMEILRKDLIRFISRLARKDKDEGIDEHQNQNRAIDTFSFIMIAPFSIPALVGWIVFFVQMTSFYISVTNDLFVQKRDDFFQNPPPIKIITLGVDPLMHISQGLSLFILLMVQESLWETLPRNQY